MTFEEINDVICESMEHALTEEQGIDPVSFSMKPSKARPEGLGFTTENAWYLFLLVFQASYLPQTDPYQRAEIDSALASSIYGKQLDEGCYDLANFFVEA